MSAFLSRASFVVPAMVAVAMAVGAPVGFTASEALAAGSSSKPTKDATKCKRGQVYSKRQKKCVDDESASLTNEDRYETGRSLALIGRFEDAILVLETADRSDPRVLNYLGYSSRNAGRMEEGMAYYEAALEIDPRFALARSYMGQALLQQGDRDGAEEQLALVGEISGEDSAEYAQLRDALQGKAGGYGYGYR